MHTSKRRFHFQEKGCVQGKNLNDRETSFVFEYTIDLYIGPLLERIHEFIRAEVY